MNKKKKVGILTYHFIRNYGAVIQACSLANFIRSEGHECVILDFRLELKTPFKQRVKNAIKSLGGLRTLPRRSIQSATMLNYIESQQLLGSLVCQTLADLEAASTDLDAIVFGSDEIWNFENIFGYVPAYMGGFNFAGDRVSYAPSFGNYTPMDGQEGKVKKMLGSFKNISVRDEHSKGVVQTMLGGTPTLVPDPTILTDLPHAPLPAGGYILVTGHLSPPQSKAVLEFGQRVNLPVISVGHRCEGIECVDADATPDIWLAYLRAATFVVSTLFHASILALKYGVPFAVFDSPEKRLKLRSFVQNFDLHHTLIPAAADADQIQAAYDQRKEVPADLIEAFRMDGVNYLRSALN